MPVCVDTVATSPTGRIAYRANDKPNWTCTFHIVMPGHGFRFFCTTLDSAAQPGTMIVSQ